MKETGKTGEEPPGTPSVAVLPAVGRVTARGGEAVQVHQPRCPAPRGDEHQAEQAQHQHREVMNVGGHQRQRDHDGKNRE